MREKPENLKVSLIAAMDEDRGIGKDGHVPWHIPADWKRFKRITLGHPVVMGRKTWESIGKPLPGRTNIVVTRQADYRAEGAVVVHDLGAALVEAARLDSEVHIIGGSEIYKLALAVADQVQLTHVSGRHGADTFFPEFEEAFREVDSEKAKDDGHRIQYVDYERITPVV